MSSAKTLESSTISPSERVDIPLMAPKKAPTFPLCFPLCFLGYLIDIKIQIEHWPWLLVYKVENELLLLALVGKIVPPRVVVDPIVQNVMAGSTPATSFVAPLVAPFQRA